jgi:hypothetical protein
VYEVVEVAGLCVCETRAMERVGQKNPKPSFCGSVSGCGGAARGGGACCGVTAPPPMLK